MSPLARPTSRQTPRRYNVRSPRPSPAGLSEAASTSSVHRGGLIVIIGIDAHTRRHSAAVIDQHGRVFGLLEIGADVTELDRLIDWIATFGADRLVAVERAKGFGLAPTRRLLNAGEDVVDIATHSTAAGRRSSRRRGKDDEIDAITIARIALREPDLPRLKVEQLDADLKLLVDARDQLVAEAPASATASTPYFSFSHPATATTPARCPARRAPLPPNDSSSRDKQPNRCGPSSPWPPSHA